MAACGRENDAGSGPSAGGADSNPEATLAGVRGVGIGANNLLVTD